MTRLKRIALGGAAAALIMTGATSKSFAIEAGMFQYLAGGTIGIPSGAAAPPGLYTGFTMFYSPEGGMTGNQGGALATAANPSGGSSVRGTGLGAIGGVVPLVWSTGWHFLGASYSMAIIQPFVTAWAGSGNNQPFPVNANTTCAAISLPLGAPTLGGLPNGLCAWQSGIINTVFQPLNLSWTLGNGWFASVYFSFQAPDGTRVIGTFNPDFWTFSPGGAFSYLSANWNASVNMVYQIYTGSAGIAGGLGGCTVATCGGTFGTGYVSGNQFNGDWHILYKFGKWEIGPVGYWTWQTTSDQAGGGGCAVLAASAKGGNGCGFQDILGIGGFVGYDFGPVDLNVWLTDTVWQRDNAEAGLTIWMRWGFRLWAPEAPKPLVAKN